MTSQQDHAHPDTVANINRLEYRLAILETKAEIFPETSHTLSRVETNLATINERLTLLANNAARVNINADAIASLKEWRAWMTGAIAVLGVLTGVVISMGVTLFGKVI
jgi:anti-sigma-K factor RskA